MLQICGEFEMLECRIRNAPRIKMFDMPHMLTTNLQSGTAQTLQTACLTCRHMQNA